MGLWHFEAPSNKIDRLYGVSYLESKICKKYIKKRKARSLKRLIEAQYMMDQKITVLHVTPISSSFWLFVMMETSLNSCSQQHMIVSKEAIMVSNLKQKQTFKKFCS